MEFIVKTGDVSSVKTDALVVGLFAARKLSETAKSLDSKLDGALASLLKTGDIEGKTGQVSISYSVPGIAAERLVLLGLGETKEFSAKSYRKAFASLFRSLAKGGARDITVALPLDCPASGPYDIGRDLAILATSSVFRTGKLKTRSKPPKRGLKRVIVIGPDTQTSRALRKGLKHGNAMGKGMELARDLADLPGNICTPSYLANQARSLARGESALQTKILDEKEMEKLAMGSLLSVSRGSRQPAKLIIMEYRGGKPKQKPVVLVGKGLTFDAGGISLKPSADMDEMKYDMCGGASVLGTIKACVELKLSLNVIGLVPSSENLPDGDANKPGDIVTSMSGQTIEVLNTDAEGRLILCDALTYAERYSPAQVIDIATLTGACIIALGHQASGLLANDEDLAGALLSAGDRTGDRAWRLPLWEEYQSQLDSNFADMANIGGRAAGTITAACFLSRFTKKFKWAHLDIAGTAWVSGKEKGATGRPVPLLVQYLLDRAGKSEKAIP